ncbi:MAG: hypothetical protein ACFFEV_00070 [Candidatus Thorarchaeota archaeon]
MKKRHSILLVATMVIVMLMPVTIESPDNTATASSILAIASDRPAISDVLELTDYVNEAGIPLILYTDKPWIEYTTVSESNNTFDTGTGIITTEHITTYEEIYYVLEYTAVMPGNSIQTLTWKYHAEDNPHFQAALENKIDELGKTKWINEDSIILSDESAIDGHWYWEQTINEDMNPSRDLNDNGWVFESSYLWDLWRSVPDYNTNPMIRVWMFEWAVHTSIDQGDYKEEILTGYNQVGPWIHERYLKNDGSYGPDEDLKRYGPSTSSGSFSYDVSCDVKISPSGPQVGFGVSRSWNEPDISIVCTSSLGFDYTEWSETFRGPTYGLLYPSIGWTPPSQVSHTSYQSYRASQWYEDAGDTTADFIQDTRTHVKLDFNFVYFIIGYTWTTHNCQGTYRNWAWVS